MATARSSAEALDLRVDDAVVLNASNRLAVCLLPCDILARVAYVARQASSEFEVAVSRRLAVTAGPVAVFEPRVVPRAYVRDGFMIMLWAYYAHARTRLHIGLRQIAVPAPHSRLASRMRSG